MTRSLSVLAVAALVLCPRLSLAADSATRSVVVTARFDSRTSLTVSTQLLHFDVAERDHAASAAVDFAAAARTHAGGEVVLSIEPLRGVGGAGGAGDVESELTFTGEGDGTLAGVVRIAEPTIAARWTDSGVRSGRLLFALRASASGIYTVPMRFVLSAP